jgi:glycosyltransferase involved in cell wall biosynthesis
MKVAIISYILPPSDSGQAMIIHRLLKKLDPDTYCLLSSKDYTTENEPGYSDKLPGKYYYLRSAPFQLKRGYRFGLRRLRNLINLPTGIILRAYGITRIVRREKCEGIMVCTGGLDILDLPASYLASILTRTHFYPYLLDQYIYMVAFAVGKNFLQRMESHFMKRAAAVIATNEFLRDKLRQQYQVEAVVIHNPCDLAEYDKARHEIDSSDSTPSGGIRIVYTGGVGELHYGAFRTLIAAINLLKRTDVTLHLYTIHRPQCETEGIVGPVVYHEHAPVSTMPHIQQQADILFLPLAFNSPHSEIVRTSSPGKMGELLASRRPILAHAPADSFISWYFRRHECGLLVDQDDPEKLAQALEVILSDAGLRDRLSNRAWERARRDFSLDKARVQFAELMGLGSV